jgi:hypothetical protein
MNDLLRYVLESGCCLALFFLIYRILLRNETYFFLNRFYLVSALLLSFVIPGLNIASPFIESPPAEAPPLLAGTRGAPAASFGPAEILLYVYLCGVALFLLRLIFHLAKLHSVIRRSGFRDCGDVKIVPVDGDFAPFSFFHVVFLNERSIGRDDLERILAHERVHIRQGHSLDVLLMELVIILEWFNPFVWPYKKSLQETHEYLADCGVIAQGFSATRYKLLLFEQHVGAQLFEFANNFKQSQIKRRLTMMSKIKSRNAAKLKLLCVLPLAVFLVLAFADPKPAESTVYPMGLTVQEAAGHGQENLISKEKAAQAQDELKKLQEKEMMLREKLKTAEDPQLKKELKLKLESILVKQEEIKVFLAKGGGPPDPNGNDLQVQHKMLRDKEMKIRELLAGTEDAKRKAELEHELQMVLEKQAQVKSMLAGNGPSSEPTIEDLKKEHGLLKQKEAEIRTMLEKTTDPQKKAELEDMLKKVLTKQEMLKSKALAMKAAQEAKK